MLGVNNSIEQARLDEKPYSLQKGATQEPTNTIETPNDESELEAMKQPSNIGDEKTVEDELSDSIQCAETNEEKGLNDQEEDAADGFMEEDSTIANLSTLAVDDGMTAKAERGNLEDLFPKKKISQDASVELEEPVHFDKQRNIGYEQIEWEKPDWVKDRKLRSHEKSLLLKEKGDLQKPITHVEKEHLDDINFEANPGILKPTEKGQAVRYGDNLQAPITKIAETKMFAFEQPDWVKVRMLRSHEKSLQLKEKGDLQKPITNVQKNQMDAINFEANQTRLKYTDKGQVARMGSSLAGPITHIERDMMADVNFEANPTFILLETQEGCLVKSGTGDLAKPITFCPRNTCDANFDANPALLKATGKGDLLKRGEDIARPITFPNGKRE